ncbi:MAG: amidohydrolase family protein [Hyphomicrobiaceae bacterium]
MAIDVHAHFYGGLVETLRHRRERPYVATTADGQATLHAMTADTPLSPSYTDVPTRLAYLDSRGIATQVMTFPGALGLDVLPPAQSLPLVTAFNDNLAAICRDSKNRLHGLAGLPLADMQAAVAELRRARLHLGLLGAILPGDMLLTIERAQCLQPLFEAADEVGALLMVHPGLAPGATPPEPFPDTSVYRASALNLQASLSHMALTLVFGGFVERYRNIAFQVVNLGGTLPFILERIDAIAATRYPGAPFPIETLRKLYFDTASLGPNAVALAVKVFGADRVMLGTDYPIFAPDTVRESVAGAAITEADKQLVLRGTAARLVSRFGGRPMGT